ncbi:testis-expressed protein 12 [Ambystoma mexicanum]|uniref:testis-expressed protein 12 n=1 Tax=Ambystoma mexicanum TaxID=8296 RepID=UPI0037E767B0
MNFSSTEKGTLSCPGPSGLAMCNTAGEVKMPSLAMKTLENKGPKRKKELEVEDSETSWCPSPAKQDSSISDNMNVGVLEKVLKDMNKEINFLLAKFSHILSERTAVDSSYIHELDEILREARAMETQLKQKRESLRSRLTMIANTLQR